MPQLHPLLVRAAHAGTPLIEGDRVTFLWKGKSAPYLRGDFTGWHQDEPIHLSRLAPGLWSHTLTLPLDAYIEYAFFADPDRDERLADPFNPRRTANGFGKDNQYFYLPERQPSPLTQRRRGIPRGTLVHDAVDTRGFIAGAQRRVHLYQPPVPGPYPLVVVWDGQDFLRRGRLPTILDNLIQAEKIVPLALAMVESRGPVRMLEYASNDFSLAYLMECVLPFANQHMELLDPLENPGAYGVLGASMGGLMALFTGLRLPGIFGKVLSLSGAFSFPDLDMVVFDLARSADPGAPRIWMKVGEYDLSMLPDSNRRMATLLKERGFEVHFEEYPAGHNYTAWRDEIGKGFETLFGR